MTDPADARPAAGASADWPSLLAALVAGDDLAPEVARAALDDVLAGEAGDARLAGLLVGLAAKGPSAAELDAMVDAMVASAVPLPLANPDSVVDIVGTGGAPRRREAALNVSTMASVVAAASGVAVCKHGNRKASSTSGSFDLLEQLGVIVDLGPDGVRRCVDEVGVGFAFARTFHPAMRHAAPVRTALGIPTVFNVLGPLAHPGGVRRVVLGVGNPDLAPLVVDVLRRRRSPRAMVVCAHDHTDEIVTTGPTTIHELRDGDVQVVEFDPRTIGIDLVEPSSIAGGSPERNADLARALFTGAPGPVADLVALNAAAARVVAGADDDLGSAFVVASDTLRSGAAARTLEALVATATAAHTPG